MPDIFPRQKRSEVMSAIRSSGNAETELRLARILREHKITGWRRNQKVFGKPDFVFRREKVALFVDGCFWHGCPKCYRRPQSNRKFWDAKIARNRGRDREVGRALRAGGWKVVRVWAHELRHENRAATKVRKALIASAV